MRLIHTSDWHLGQNFYTRSRAPEHQAFLNWLLEAVERHQVDAIIVAGDIFDTGSPPSYARELYNRFVVQLQGIGCELHVLGGNHDSVATLNESRELLACLNTRVYAGTDVQATMMHCRDGSAGAVLCPIPYLRPRDIIRSQAGLSGAEKQQQLLEAMTDYYQQCWQAACALRGDQSLPVVATGHLTTVGASKSDAVRDIYIGTLEAFPARNFPPADYIALGHIHRPQRIGGSEHIRYSGSPIPLSFDETGAAKSVNLVTFSHGALESVTPLEVPVSQPLAVVKGSFGEIENQLAAWRDAPAQPTTWLDIEVVTDDYLHDIQKKIQHITESLPVEIILLRRSREQRQRALERLHSETLSELSVEDVFERRLALETLDEPHQERLRALLRETLHGLDEEASV
ncbi:exonuclease subunit SbcD [Entomohabitans teleogrylli]|uniref:exonuclease subunit SbcD n=1 Tax=Entomohabitans teleogrylli TaxID=1384589 RepID=UPI00073D8E21|nr:exonuclease subunit SbcD [Entomohabitans teleogrylli]